MQIGGGNSTNKIAIDGMFGDDNNAQRRVATQEKVVESCYSHPTHQRQKDQCCRETDSNSTPHHQTNSTQLRRQPRRSGHSVMETLSTRTPRQPINAKKTRSKRTVPQLSGVPRSTTIVAQTSSDLEFSVEDRVP